MIKNLQTLMVCLYCAFMAMGATAQEKKNLLFIITDQHRYDAMGIAGNTVIKTPNLDRLGKKGAFFTNAYTPCAVCGPARSSMLTGSSVESTGVNSNEQTYNYNKTEVMLMPTFDEILAENGYRCEYYGKWHAMTNRAEVYANPVRTANNGKSVFGSGGQSHIWQDYLKGQGTVPQPGVGQFKDGMSKYPYIANPLDRYYGMTYADYVNAGLSHSQPDQHGQLLMGVEHTMTAFQARQTLEAIERLKDETFSITCSFHFPHSPMLVPSPYYGMYPPADMVPPESIDDNMQNSPYANSNSRTKRTEYADRDKIKYMISEYYGIITEIDDWVGKILDKLDALGIADNTMIIFTSDHGEMLGAHGMREKNVFLEESAHIPLLISSPGQISPETTVDGYISLLDLFPTILDYLEVPEKESDGTSLRGLIEGTDAQHGQYVVTEWDRENNPNYMILKNGWKLIIPYTITSTVINAMYDLNTDPHEMNNLLGNNPDRANYLEKAEELRSCLLEWLAKQNSVHYYSVSKRDLLNGGQPTGNDALFVSQSMPQWVPGSTVSVSVTMKNTGSTTWTKEGNYKLMSQSPSQNVVWGTDRVNLQEGESILPNAHKTFTFDVKVPSYNGNFSFQWQMIQEAEEWFGDKSELKVISLGQPSAFMDDCDAVTDWNSSGNIIISTSDQKQGSGCIEFNGSGTDEFKKSFSTPYDSKINEANGVLQFWYYVSDPSLLGTSNQVEISSSGKADTNEYSWNLSGLSAGWNFVSLNISDANKSGSPNLSALNWFRLYNNKSGSVKSRIDAIQIVDNTNTSVFDDIRKSTGKEILIYPNPLKGKDLTIELKGCEPNASLDIQICNIWGQMVYKQQSLFARQFVIDTGAWARNSLYIVTVRCNGVTSSAKLIIE